MKQGTSSQAVNYIEGEHRVKRGSQVIYGRLYRPAEEGRHPAVILSHGYNGSHEYREPACAYFAENGFVAYAYDFCGGSVNSKSSGETVDMTIGSEKADLLAVFEDISQRDDVDATQIYLLGESQGGFVSSLVAEELGERIKGMALFYPALNIPDDWRKKYQTVEAIPEVTDLWGMKLGKRFFTEIRDFYTFDHIGQFGNEVLFLHGDRDEVVSLENSQKAVFMYPKAELVVLEGEGHGFKPDAERRAIERVLAFMKQA